MDESGEQLVARAAKGLEEEVERGVTIPIGRGFAGRIVSDRRAITIEDVDHAEILNPLLREKGIRSLLGVPLIVEGRALGVLHVGTLTPRRFDETDAELLQAAGDRAALAIEHGQLFEAERRAREAAEARAPAALALEHVGDGVFLLDDEDRIRFWNPAAAAMTGVSAEHALGRAVREVITAWESVRSIVPSRSRRPSRGRRPFRWRLQGASSGCLCRASASEAERSTPSATSPTSAAASRLGVDVLEVAESAVDPLALADDVIESLRVHTRADVQYEVVAPPVVPRVAGDAERLRHVLRNLLENAAKYSPGGGTVTVRLEPQERHLRFAVQDEGLGIPPHERAHVFERFYRIDEHAKRGIGGTGLGLYISRELVRRMRGRIWVSSEQVRGSTFFVELPLADADPEPVPDGRLALR